MNLYRGEIAGYKYMVNRFEGKSSCCICNSHINKLLITKDNKDVVIYNQDWVLKPKTEQEKSIYNIVYNMYKKIIGDR